jgi:hypothetical protein
MLVLLFVLPAFATYAEPAREPAKVALHDLILSWLRTPGFTVGFSSSGPDAEPDGLAASPLPTTDTEVNTDVPGGQQEVGPDADPDG